MFNQYLKIALALTVVLVSQLSMAENTEQIGKTHQSVGQFKKLLTTSEQSKASILKDAKSSLALKPSGHLGKLRNDVNELRKMEADLSQSRLVTKQKQALNGLAGTASAHHSFAIYSGYSELLTDIDGDGYFRSFSVSFDADVLSPFANEQALVYADLYLSENGGPWILYFSTDDFVITADSSDDEFEVITQLDSGYIPEHYDVLIDLYEVGYGDVVATYSSDDTNALYALPLESSDYDPEYIEVVHVEEHGGSSHWMFISIMLFMLFRRRFKHK